MREWQFWSLVWACATAAGTLRTLRDSDYRDVCSLVSAGLFSGLVGFGMVAYWVSSDGGHVGHVPYYLGLAVIFGALGKEQDKFVRYVITKTFQAVGMPGMFPQEDNNGDDGPGPDDVCSDGSDRN